MTNIRTILLATALAMAAALPVAAFSAANAATASDLNRDSDMALQNLYRAHPFAEQLSNTPGRS